MSTTASHRAGSHAYAARLLWTGNRREGTADYAGYGRGYRISIAGKPDIVGTAAAAFLGEPDVHDPEDFFLAAIASCHMLAYLALCARSGVVVTGYEDHADGTLALDERGGGRFERVTLRPVVTVADAAYAGRALALHDAAHRRCFIAASCSVPIGHEAVVRVEGA